MKKIVSVVLLVCFLASCASCAETSSEDTTPVATTPAETPPAGTTPVATTPADSTPAATTPVATTPAPNPSMGMPPQNLYFDSLEELRELKTMMERNDDAAKEWLRQNINYYWNGLSCMDEVKEMFDKLGNLHFYYLAPSSGYTLVEISYRPQPNGTHHVAETDILSIMFKRETALIVIWYGFNREPRPELDYPVVGYVTLKDGPVKLYDTQREVPWFAIQEDTEEYNFEISFIRCNAEDIETLINEHLVYATLYELMEMY